MRHSSVPRGILAGPALAFVVDSEQRLIAHCDKLLGAADLPPAHRDRLLRLRSEAEARLGRLTFALAA
jgi:hypothetical protein